MITSNADAEFGRSSGGQINVITKSGTNQLHGDVFEFARNRPFDARSFFETNLAFKRDGKAIAPPFTQNNFGATLGGPIRKNKTFFFASINFIYDLPFGEGRSWGHNLQGFAGKLIGGWQANGIMRFQTGSPFSLLAGQDVNGNATANDRAALLSGSLTNLLNPTFKSNGSLQYLTLNNGATLGITPAPQIAGSMLPIYLARV